MPFTTACKQCQTKFEITDSDLAFYKRIDVPVPKRCPQCRLIRRLNERNTKTLYFRTCGLTGQRIISQYHESQPFPVYSTEAWWGDSWDGLDFGQEFDPNRQFFDQFQEVENKTPHFAAFIIGGTLQNSDFTNCTGYLKNCYLIAEADYNEDCYYSNRLNYCKNIVDCSFAHGNELCYECVDCVSCYSLKYSQDCVNCAQSAFLFNCQGLRDCIGCINQRHKQYMIFNKQYSRDEYEKIAAEFALDTNKEVKVLQKKCRKFFISQPHKNLQNEHNQNCTGNHLTDSKNSFYCFDCKDLEDCKYCMRLTLTVKNSMDYTGWGMNSELVYDCAACGDHAYNIKFCTNCTTNLVDCEYCHQCTASRDLFGCVGLKRKQYCILNKQYSKEKYLELKRKIIEHMTRTGEYGEFFPPSACPFGYNETIAMDIFPLTKEGTLKKGYRWKDPDDKKILPQTAGMPENVKDAPDSIINEILACGTCGKNYRIIAQELKIYRQMSIPIPRACPACRHTARMALREPPRLYERPCMKCGAKMQTTYAPDKPATPLSGGSRLGGKIVYCEKCYLETVY